MNRFAFASLLLAACTGGERASSGECPAGEVCSDQTPNGLHFLGDTMADSAIVGVLTAPAATAIGGTQHISLDVDHGGVLVPLDRPFQADDDGALGVSVVAQDSSSVTIRGEGSRTNYLRILDADGLLMDRKDLTGAALKSIGVLSLEPEVVPLGAEVAFAPGKRSIGVALYGDVQDGSSVVTERIVDSSATLSASGGTQQAWDHLELANAQVGTTQLSVTAGDKPTAVLDVRIAAEAQHVVAQAADATIPAHGGTDLCFSATVDGRVLVGLAWTFTVDGAPVTGGAIRNCVYASTTAASGTVTVVANAGGQSATLQVPVGQAAWRAAPVLGHAGRGTAAGDRASM